MQKSKKSGIFFHSTIRCFCIKTFFFQSFQKETLVWNLPSEFSHDHLGAAYHHLMSRTVLVWLFLPYETNGAEQFTFFVCVWHSFTIDSLKFKANRFDLFDMRVNAAYSSIMSSLCYLRVQYNKPVCLHMEVVCPCKLMGLNALSPGFIFLAFMQQVKFTETENTVNKLYNVFLKCL